MHDLLAGEENGTLNIHSQSRDERARRLSPLFNRPFELDDTIFSSFEGFFNGIKFPEGDKRRKLAFASSYGHAQRFGSQTDGATVWWNGRVITSGSAEHLALIKRAHRASVLQDEDRRNALLNTAGLRLIHQTGTPPDRYYPPQQFCADLTEIRNELVTP